MNPTPEQLARAISKPERAARIQSGYVRGYGHQVVLKSRDDLFDPATGDELEAADGTKLPGLQLFTHNSITGIPDNVGCCEIVSVGKDVTIVKPGDVVFIDFFDVRQGVILDSVNGGSEHYIANDDAFKATFDSATGLIHPLAGYVVTRRNNERMKVALTGTDRLEVPPSTLTEGIIGSRSSDGTPATWVVYEEVVEVGPPAEESLLRPMTKAERALLYMIEHPQFDSRCLEEMKAIAALRSERNAPRELDLKPGDLVPLCTYLAVQVRVRGEFLRIVEQKNVMGIIDDRKMLDDAIRAGKAGKLQMAPGITAGFGATLGAAQAGA